MKKAKMRELKDHESAYCQKNKKLFAFYGTGLSF